MFSIVPLSRPQASHEFCSRPRIQGDFLCEVRPKMDQTTPPIPPSSDGLIASLTSHEPDSVRRVAFDITPASIWRVLLTLAALWFVLHILPVVILMVLSLMLVATFNPLVSRLQVRMRRSWAIVGVVSGVVLLFLGTLAVLIPPFVYQSYKLIENAPDYTRQLQALLARQHIRVNVGAQVDEIIGNFRSATPELMRVLSHIVSLLTAFATVAILTIYLLIEGPQVGTNLLRLLPRADRLRTRKLVIEIGTKVGDYMRGQLITSAIAGGFSFVVLWAAGIPAALALGAWAAIADAIPLVGSLIALLPAALLALTLSPGKAGFVIVAYLIYNQLESHIIGPKIYGNTLGLSLSVIVISLLIGVELMGMMGALIALPVAAAIPSVIAFIQEWQEAHHPPETEPETAG